MQNISTTNTNPTNTSDSDTEAGTTNPDLTALAYQLFGVLFACIAILVMLAPGASAESADSADDPIYTELDSGIELEMTPFDIDDIVVTPIDPPTPNWPVVNDTVVDCGTETIDISVHNGTNSDRNIRVFVEGNLDPVHELPIDSGLSRVFTVDTSGNDDTMVAVLSGGHVIFEEFIATNCVDVDFEFVTDCDAGHAWARLTNDGIASVLMGVHYIDVMGMDVPVDANDSIDWLLANEPGEYFDFEIHAAGEVIHTGGFDFVCETDEIDGGDETETDTDDATETDGETKVDTGDAGEGNDASKDDDRTDSSDRDDIELAAGTDLPLQAAGDSSASVMVGLLLALGVATTVGAIAALRRTV